MFKLEFATDNAAFDGDPWPEIDRILRDVSERASFGQSGGPIRDVNGNRIGEWSATRNA